MELTVLDDIETKLLTLESKLRVAQTESMDIARSAGRILAQEVLNFRDSPPMDVSAMDGYACRLEDLQVCASRLPVDQTATAGAAPLELSGHRAIRIFTGAVVPKGANVVIPRERCDEKTDRVAIQMPLDQIKLGWNIRRQAENARQGDVALSAGCRIDGPRISSLVSMHQHPQILVHRKVRVAIINTGDELLDIGMPIQPWQIRDSNGPLLECSLQALPWTQWTRTSVKDDLPKIQSAIEQALQDSDAIILTGGVSMGDTDHVPTAVQNAGGKIVFHRLPIRPGAPILAAASDHGQLILGLPGNPVSVAVTFRRYGLPLLEHLTGKIDRSACYRTELANSDEKTLHLVWFRLVKIQPDSTALLLPSQGSGDLRSLGLSDGFIEVPPQTPSKGSFRYYDWSPS